MPIKGDYVETEDYLKTVFGCKTCGWKGTIVCMPGPPTKEIGQKKHDRQCSKCPNPKVVIVRGPVIADDPKFSDDFREDTGGPTKKEFM